MPDPRVPEQQAVITPEQDGVWTIAPLRDDSPLLLRGEELTDKTALADGDELAILHYRLTISLDGEGNKEGNNEGNGEGNVTAAAATCSSA